MENYKILRLQVEGLRKISAIDISPGENLVKITGKNEAGKSTILDSILYAIGGGKVEKEDIQKGKNKASVTLDIGAYIVEKRITEAGAYLAILTKDGNASLKSPQSFLDNLVGTKLLFDPMQFMTLDPMKQREMLLKALDVDIDGINQRYNTLYDERTIENRILKEKTSQAQAYIAVEPAEHVNISGLSVESSNLMTERTNIKNQKNALENLIKDAEETQKEINSLLKQLEKQKKEIEIMKALPLDQKEKEIDDRMQTITQSIANAEATNKQARDYEEKVKLQTAIEVQEKKIAKINESMENCQKEKTAAFAGKVMPIEGLEILDNGISLNGNKHLSTSQAIKVSMAIAMALNSQFRVILIRRGESLDDESMKIIEDIAKANDFQVWIEIVSSQPDDSDNSAFHIVEGEIQKKDGLFE
jgi:chromosome segregation ATPase